MSRAIKVLHMYTRAEANARLKEVPKSWCASVERVQVRNGNKLVPRYVIVSRDGNKVQMLGTEGWFIYV